MAIEGLKLPEIASATVNPTESAEVTVAALGMLGLIKGDREGITRYSNPKTKRNLKRVFETA